MQLVQVDGANWQGIYLDGELKIEGRILYLRHVVEVLIELGQPVTSFEWKEVDEYWLKKRQGLPTRLEEVKFA